MKKRSVLAVASLAAGAVIAVISPPQGADTAETREPAQSVGMLSDSGDVDPQVDSTVRTPDTGFGVSTPDVSGDRTL
ncbi:hypothetical protein ACGFSB_37070 [Streptomyces sp. NPDC048441]|uniref:hypothetical protein n=1 Tax=Streptomyces sp. NPDC048441 TaxID=3365552 RepID=UPI00372211B6